jgi:hypothetical protein
MTQGMYNTKCNAITTKLNEFLITKKQINRYYCIQSFQELINV